MIDKIFAGLVGEYQYELYDESENLILQKNNSS